jgi:hypothetical protein
MIKPEEYNQKGKELKYIGSLYSLLFALSKKCMTINTIVALYNIYWQYDISKFITNKF